ncbi:MAG: hypothetical protein GQ477_03245 [Nanohaloarchaea archaeon]|nr:hypothetical protein [Candidatus Nanohaloarchaea archaeon]
MDGIVESISELKKSRNGKPYFIICISGESFSVWEPSYIENVSVGDTVEFSHSVSGNFKNITSIEKKIVEEMEIVPEKIETEYPIEFQKGTEVDTSNRVDERLCEISNKLSVIIDILLEKSSEKK